MSSHPNMWLRGLQIQINHDAPNRNYRPRIIKSGICSGMWNLINSALNGNTDDLILISFFLFFKSYFEEKMLFINIFYVVGLVINKVFNFCSPSKLNFLNRLQGRVVQLHEAGRLFLDAMQSIAPDLLKIITRPGTALVWIIVFLHAKWCQ